MVNKADFKITLNSRDITKHIKENLISLSLDDKDGKSADELTILLNGIYSRPEYKDELHASLGYIGRLNNYGIFTAVSSSIDYISNTTEVKASSVDFSSNLKIKKNQLYENTNLKDIVGKIASQHGIKYKTDADIKIVSILQQDESDLEFLLKLAKDYGYIFSIKNSVILFLKRAETESLPVFKIELSECLSLRIDTTNKRGFTGCKIIYQDIDSATSKSVSVGTADVMQVIDAGTVKSEAEAEAMAKSILEKNKKSNSKGSLSTIGREIRAGGKLKLTGTKIDDGEFDIKSVSHRLDSSSYTVDVEFE